MDRKRVQDITADLHVVLAEFAKKHDLEDVMIKNVEFDNTGFRTTIYGRDVLYFTERQEEFDKKAKQMGLPTGGYGKVFDIYGVTYQVVDINTRAHKYPVIAQDDNGKQHKFISSVLY